MLLKICAGVANFETSMSRWCDIEAAIAQNLSEMSGNSKALLPEAPWPRISTPVALLYLKQVSQGDSASYVVL